MRFTIIENRFTGRGGFLSGVTKILNNMKARNLNLDYIMGIELTTTDTEHLKGGYEDGLLWCVSCKDSGWEHLGNIEYEGEPDHDQMRTACQAVYPLTQHIAYTKKGSEPCDPA